MLLKVNLLNYSMIRIVYISVFLNVIVLGFLVFNHLSTPAKQIGIVRMEKVVYEYEGMKEATKKYENKVGAWKQESDSLEFKLKNVYSELKADSISNNKTKLARDLNLFYLYRNSYIELNKNIDSKIKETDGEMTSSVITQLNAHMSDYAKENNYDLILCNNPQYQAIGFSKNQYDITGKFLEFANKKYNDTK